MNFINFFILHHLMDIAAVIMICVLTTLLIAVRIKKNKQREIKNVQLQKSKLTISSSDIKAIAGDDVMATQLDLARAYLEMNKKSLARQILEHVISHGTKEQQDDAHHLIQQI